MTLITSVQPGYLDRLNPEMLLAGRLAAAVAVQLDIHNVEGRPARRRHHLNSDPEPLLELVLSSQWAFRKVSAGCFGVALFPQNQL